MFVRRQILIHLRHWDQNKRKAPHIYIKPPLIIFQWISRPPCSLRSPVFLGPKTNYRLNQIWDLLLKDGRFRLWVRAWDWWMNFVSSCKWGQFIFWVFVLFWERNRVLLKYLIKILLKNFEVFWNGDFVWVYSVSWKVKREGAGALKVFKS